MVFFIEQIRINFIFIFFFVQSIQAHVFTQIGKIFSPEVYFIYLISSSSFMVLNIVMLQVFCARCLILCVAILRRKYFFFKSFYTQVTAMFFQPSIGFCWTRLYKRQSGKTQRKMLQSITLKNTIWYSLRVFVVLLISICSYVISNDTG